MKVIDLVNNKANLKNLFNKFNSYPYTIKWYYVSAFIFLIELCLLIITLFADNNSNSVNTLGSISTHLFSLSLLLFSISVIIDIIEFIAKKFPYTSTKFIGVIIFSVISIFSLVSSHHDINQTFGVHPSFLGFTISIVSILYIILIFSIISALLCGGMILASILINCTYDAFVIKRKKIKFHWKLRLVGIFSLFVLSSVFIGMFPFESRIKNIVSNLMPHVKMPNDNNSLIKEMGIYLDFNHNHHCKNLELQDKPVLFLDNRFVLFSKEEDINYNNKINKDFRIIKCVY